MPNPQFFDCLFLVSFYIFLTYGFNFSFQASTPIVEFRDVVKSYKTMPLKELTNEIGRQASYDKAFLVNGTIDSTRN